MIGIVIPKIKAQWIRIVMVFAVILLIAALPLIILVLGCGLV